jgi:Sec-independent protein translocase protein TatA
VILTASLDFPAFIFLVALLLLGYFKLSKRMSDIQHAVEASVYRNADAEEKRDKKHARLESMIQGVGFAVADTKREVHTIYLDKRKRVYTAVVRELEENLPDSGKELVSVSEVQDPNDEMHEQEDEDVGGP